MLHVSCSSCCPGRNRYAEWQCSVTGEPHLHRSSYFRHTSNTSGQFSALPWPSARTSTYVVVCETTCSAASQTTAPDGMRFPAEPAGGSAYGLGSQGLSPHHRGRLPSRWRVRHRPTCAQALRQAFMTFTVGPALVVTARHPHPERPRLAVDGRPVPVTPTGVSTSIHQAPSQRWYRVPRPGPPHEPSASDHRPPTCPP